MGNGERLFPPPLRRHQCTSKSLKTYDPRRQIIQGGGGEGNQIERRARMRRSNSLLSASTTREGGGREHRGRKEKTNQPQPSLHTYTSLQTQMGGSSSRLLSTPPQHTPVRATHPFPSFPSSPLFMPRRLLNSPPRMCGGGGGTSRS